MEPRAAEQVRRELVMEPIQRLKRNVLNPGILQEETGGRGMEGTILQGVFLRGGYAEGPRSQGEL